jgi:hypothetical protein
MGFGKVPFPACSTASLVPNAKERALGSRKPNAEGHLGSKPGIREVVGCGFLSTGTDPTSGRKTT